MIFIRLKVENFLLEFLGKIAPGWTDIAKEFKEKKNLKTEGKKGKKNDVIIFGFGKGKIRNRVLEIPKRHRFVRVKERVRTSSSSSRGL